MNDNILEPNYNGLLPVTDWEKVFVALQQVNEKVFRGASAKEFGKQVIGDVAIQGADFEDLPIATSSAPVVLPIPQAEMKFGFLANGRYTQPNGPDLVYTDKQWGLVLFNSGKWVKKFTIEQPDAIANGTIESGNNAAISGDTTYKEFYGKSAVTEDVNYTKDLSTYGTLVNNNFLYVNNVKTLNDKERLKSVSVKTPTGSVINVYAYKVTGANGSLVFEELHHYGSYTATTQNTTINFTDAYEMPLGTVIAISSSLGIYYKQIGGLVGTYTTQVSWTGTELAHSFVTTKILTPAKEGVYPQLESQKTDIENVSDRVTELEENGTPALGKIQQNDTKAISGDTAFKGFYGSEEISESHDYTKDLSTYTTLDANNGRIYINNVKTLNDKEVLTFVSVKAPIGSIIKVYAYKVTGANGSLVFERLHTFDEFTTENEIETYSYTDEYEMPLGTMIGISSSKSIYYRNKGGLSGVHPALVSWTGTELAHSFKTKVVTTPAISGVYNDIDQLDVRVTALEAGGAPTGHKLSGKVGVVEGDSLMEQNFVIPQLQAIIGCTFIRQAKSGSGYAYNRNGTIRSRVEGIEALTKDFILIGSGGTNDWRNNILLGSSSVIDDDNQFYSAVYNTFRILREQNPTTPILVCTPTQGFYSSETRKTVKSGGYFYQFVDVIKDVAKIFAIQVCDLYSLSGITYENIDDYTSDGLHVNTAGGKLMAEKIAQALDTLVV